MFHSLFRRISGLFDSSVDLTPRYTCPECETTSAVERYDRQPVGMMVMYQCPQCEELVE